MTAIVGRDADLARLAAFARSETKPVMYLHGAAGSGKTMLLREWLRREAARGSRVAIFDAALESFDPSAVVALARGADVIAFDDFQRVALLETWFYETFLPSLGANVRVVVASRRAPRHSDRSDAVWASRVDVLELGALSPADSAAFLELRGVAAPHRASILEFAHGLPLWLGIGADLALAHPETPFESVAPSEHLQPIVARLVEEAEEAGPGRRRALDAAALFAFVTESRLAAALDVSIEESSAAYRWLCERPFVQRAAKGVRLHDLLRDALRAELSWRDPEGIESMLDRIYPYLVERIHRATGPEQERRFLELCRMLRKEPGGALLGGDVDEAHYADAVADSELPIFVDAVRRYEGEEAAAIARAWLEHARDGLVGFRDASQALVGFVQYVRIDPKAVSRDPFPSDPCVSALLDEMARTCPLREGERATIARFWFGLDGYQRPDAMQLRLWGHMTFTLVLAAADVLVGAVHPDPEHWLRRPDRAHDLFGTFELGGRPHGIFGQDWRRASRQAWFGRMVSAYRHGPAAPPGVQNELDVLDRTRFDAAVRAALRAWSDSTKLEANPLLRTRLVPDRSASGLRDVIRATVDELARATTTSRHAAVVEHAFMRKAQKGLAIAAELGLPYGSYRRLLGEAVSRIVEALWMRERKTS